MFAKYTDLVGKRLNEKTIIKLVQMIGRQTQLRMKPT